MSTISTSDTELIESTYMVTPTSTGGPAKHNRLRVHIMGDQLHRAAL